jgi:hypothetical protein
LCQAWQGRERALEVDAFVELNSISIASMDFLAVKNQWPAFMFKFRNRK